jgi:nicotinate-nucleotide pyrophosphorylase
MPKLTNSNTFHAGVEALVRKHKMKYMEAVIFYCDSNGLEIEAAATMIKSNARVKALLHGEATELNFLAKPQSE